MREAGVTRGALYHHFDGKRDLLRAVYEQLESEIAEDLAERAVPGASVLETLRSGADRFLDHCLEPEVQRIALLDAPAVLGWETHGRRAPRPARRWRCWSRRCAPDHNAPEPPAQ